MVSHDNPYHSPHLAAEAVSALPPRLTIPRMLALLAIGGIGGAALGMLTNSVNGALSPQYFRDVMDWNGSNIWGSAVRQGALEGLIYGLAYAVIFIWIIVAVSHRRCRFPTALRYARLTFALAISFWLIGGTIAVGLARLMPNICDPQFFGYDFTWPALGCYAWVRGSIWGVVYGGLCSVLLTSVRYAFREGRSDLEEHDPMKPGPDEMNNKDAA